MSKGSAGPRRAWCYNMEANMVKCGKVGHGMVVRMWMLEDVSGPGEARCAKSGKEYLVKIIDVEDAQ